MRTTVKKWKFDIKADFHHWAVGAGFFSSHALYMSSNSGYQRVFSGVYDCGTNRSRTILEREVDEFLRVSGKEHDVLWISHYDIDHIKGLPVLKNRQATFRTVYAPHLTPETRFYMFATSLGSNSDDADLVEDLSGFIANPEAYLADLSDEVLFVEPAGDGTSDPEAEPEDNSGIEIGEESEENLSDWTVTTDFSKGVTNNAYTLSVKKRGSKKNSTPIWRWSHIMLTDPHSLQDSFLDEFATRLGRSRQSLNRSLSIASDVFDFIINHRKELKDALKKVAKAAGTTIDTATNDSSLLMSSTPTTRPTAYRCWRTRSEQRIVPAPRPEIGAWNIQPGWVAFGDAPLGLMPEFSQVKKWISAYGESVGVLCLPHHGSAKHQSADLYQLFPAHPSAVVGADGQYQHPSYKTVCQAACYGCSFVVVAEEVRARFTHSSTVKFTS